MMELPKIVRQIGNPESRDKVYVEDYVLGYLEQLKNRKINESTQIILYGRNEYDIFGKVCLIYGAAAFDPDCENELWNEKRQSFSEYEEVGCLNTEIWQPGRSGTAGILIGNSNGGQEIDGCFVFCDKNPCMEEYLQTCFEEEQRKRTYTKKAELIAQSRKEPTSESFIFELIRTIVICIFIVFCAIAVMTVNSYEKMNEFTQTAAEIEKPVENQ